MCGESNSVRYSEEAENLSSHNLYSCNLRISL